MSARIASLGMYDLPELAPANDRLWQAIAIELRRIGVVGVPDCLDRSRSLNEIWKDPALLLAQSCGYPMLKRLRGSVRYLATPIYGAPGCRSVEHRSRIVSRLDDDRHALSAFRGSVAAMNDRESNTGMNLLRAAVAPLAGQAPFFVRVIETGSHRDSAQMVASGDSDIAAIDTVTYAHLERWDPELVSRLRTIGWTEFTPCLPFVTSIHTTEEEAAAMVRAIRRAILGLSEYCKAELLIEGVRRIPPGRYDKILALELHAKRLGYPELA